MKHLLFLILASTVMLEVGCGKRPSEPKADSQSNTPPPAASPAFGTLTADQVLSALKSAGLPIENEAIYTAETDPNKLLARPHQYTGKASWHDKRADTYPKGDQNMTVEVFADPEAMESRHKYTESIGKGFAPVAEWHFMHKNALLRLHHDLTPAQAAEYEKALKAL